MKRPNGKPEPEDDRELQQKLAELKQAIEKLPEDRQEQLRRELEDDAEPE